MISDSGAGRPGPGTGDGVEPARTGRGFLASAWFDAQARQAATLAEVALAVGAFRERMRSGSDGARCRILFWQAAAIASATGECVPVDQLALMRAGQILGPGSTQPSLRRASAVLDVLEGAMPPAMDVSAEAAPLHLLIRSACVVLREPGIDPAIALARAVRLSTPDPAEQASFVPVLPKSWPGPWMGGTAEVQLSWWLEALQAGCSEAMALLSELEAWHHRADRVIEGWSGRIPSRLIRAIGAWPVLSAAMAETDSRASRAAVQRNLDRLQREGLVREVTGQDRYRLWAADFGPLSPIPGQSTQD